FPLAIVKHTIVSVRRRRKTMAVHKCFGHGGAPITLRQTRRRRFGAWTAISIASLVHFTHSAMAQDWPTRPVTMVVPFAAGSASDTLARILGARLSEILGQQVIIENVGGAGGMTGVARVAKATPDGYQFVLGGVDTFAQNQTLYKKPL